MIEDIKPGEAFAILFDNLANIYGVARSPGETDAMLVARLANISKYPPHGIPNQTLHLWLLLARLGIRSVPRDVFPAGIAI